MRRVTLVFLLPLFLFSLSMVSSAQVNAGERLLVWTAAAAAPGQHSGDNPGQIAYLDSGGVLTPLMDVPQRASRVTACGEEALSPDGSLFAFYMGQDVGNLYLTRGGEVPVMLDDVGYLSCLGAGTFQYAPNGVRLAFIDFDERSTQGVYADGFLKVYSAADLTQQLSSENVTAFDINSDGVVYVSFFTNDRGEADEAAVIWWDGSSEREVATLVPQPGCQFTSGQVAIAPDGNFVMLTGHRCTSGDTRTSWQLYTVDSESREATLGSSDFQPGVFAAFTRSNNLWFSTDGSVVYFTVPDGLTANTAAVATAALADMSINIVLERQAIFPTFSGAANAYPRRSPDSAWLAAVVTSPNAENSLTAFDLRNPSVAPIVVTAGSRGDTVAALTFTPDSKHVIFVAGGDEGDNNALFTLQLSDSTENRAARGRFAPPMALAPDGGRVALLDWQVIEDDPDPAYANLVAVDIASGAVTTLFQGADIVEGEAENLRFAAPLVWLVGQ